RKRVVLVVRIRPADRVARRARLRGPAGFDFRDAAPGAAPRLQRARERALRRPEPAALDRGSARVPGGEGVRLLVAGGAGFIGSTFVRVRLRGHGEDVTVLDKLTYA